MIRRATNLLQDGGARFAHDLAAVATGQLLSKIIGFAAFAFMARTVPPSTYGQVEFVVSVTTFLALIVGFGLGPVGVRRIAESPRELPQVAASITSLQLLLAVAAAPFVLLAASLVAYPPETQLLSAFFGVSLLFLGFNREWLLQSQSLMSRVAAAQVLRAAIFAAVVVLFVRGSANAYFIGVAELASVVAFVAFHVWTQARRITPLRLAFDPRKLVELAREGASVGAANVLWALQQYAPLILLAPIAGPVQFAWFAAAQRIVLSLLTFSSVYHFSLFPALSRLYEADKSLHLATVRAALRAMSAVSLAGALALALLAEPVVAIAFGARFTDAAPLLAILVWSIPFAVIGGHARWTLITVRRPLFVLIAQAAGAAAGLLSGIVLVPLAGVVGGSIAVAIMALTVTAVAHASAMRFVPGFPGLGYSALLLMTALGVLAVAQALVLAPLLEAVGGVALFIVAALGFNPNLGADILRLIYARKDDEGPAAVN
jgi:O-antigen/teichoic acid export membrane protein